VGSQGSGVARVGPEKDQFQEFLRRFRENERVNLVVLSQEVLRSFDQLEFLNAGPDPTAQNEAFTGVKPLSFPGDGQGENVAETSIGGDNVSKFQGLDEANGASVRGQGREEGTVGTLPEPPLSSVDRPAPPLPTNIRSRFVPVVTVNLLDLVL
jgi:hypothetical protein